MNYPRLVIANLGYIRHAVNYVHLDLTCPRNPTYRNIRRSPQDKGRFSSPHGFTRQQRRAPTRTHVRHVSTRPYEALYKLNLILRSHPAPAQKCSRGLPNLLAHRSIWGIETKIRVLLGCGAHRHLVASNLPAKRRDARKEGRSSSCLSSRDLQRRRP